MNEKTKELLLRFAPEKVNYPNDPRDMNWGYIMTRGMIENSIAKNYLEYIPWDKVNKLVQEVEESKGTVEFVKFNVYEGYIEGIPVLQWLTVETKRVAENNTLVRIDYFC